MAALLMAFSSGMAAAVPLRIVPMDPELLNVDPKRGEMTFFCPEVADPAGLELVATVCGRERRVVLDADSKARVSFGVLPTGRQPLSVQLRDGKTGATVVSNAYEIAVGEPVVLPATATRLNNFVTELGRFEVMDGWVRFTNPREGWVFVRVGAFERMARLARGDCALAVPNGVCVVRLVKPIYHGGLEFPPEGAQAGAMCPFSKAFHEKWVYGNYNTYSGALAPADVAKLRAGGGAFLSTGRIRSRDRKLRSDIGAMVTVLEAVERGDGLVVDEMSLTLEGEYNRNFGEACWQLLERGRKEPLVSFWCDVIDNEVADPRQVASALSAAINSGDGKGLIATEHYLCARPTAQAALRQIDKTVDFARSLRAVTPCGPRHVMYYLGGYLRPGDWNAWCSPAPDMKAYYVMLLRRLATDPEFADLGGVGFSRFYCDEEIARFACAAIRHYCIEGRTDDLNKTLGLRYLPRLLKNGDFDAGFEGWTAEAAEKDSLTTSHRVKYGRKEQGRIGGGKCGDSFALFTRSATGPNRLWQRITGLEPGKTYSLSYITADYDDVLKPGGHPTNVLVRVSVSPAEIDESRGTLSFWPPDRFPSGRRPRGAVTVSHKVVFRATGTETEVVFSDWNEGKPVSNRPGARCLLNYVGLRPYFDR